MAASHFAFVAGAYGFAGFVLCALLAWIALDYRAQRRALAAFEARRADKQ